jgi:Flp pilus assembly protein TadG
VSQRRTAESRNRGTSGLGARATSVTRDQSGGTVLKLAIAVPLLAFVLSAIVLHGHYFAVDHHVQQLTVEAARATVFGRTSQDRQQIAVKSVDAAIDSYPLLRRDRVRVDVTDAPEDQGIYQVTIVYDAKDIGFWSLDRFVPMPPSTIRHSSTVRRGSR